MPSHDIHSPTNAAASLENGPSQRAAAALRDFTLDADQLAAVEHADGPLIVLAGPGAGKTRVLTARTLRLLRDGATPESVLVLTFTIKAANEMRQRLAVALGDEALRVHMMTFHALAWRLINRFSDLLGLPAQLRLRDSAETKRLIRTICRREGLFSHRGTQSVAGLARQLAQFIGHCRSANRSPEDALDAARAWGQRLAETDDAHHATAEREAELASARDFADAARLYELFDRTALQQGLIGYDDTLVLARKLLEHRRFAGPIIRGEFRHVLVDEFQDVNEAQIQMLAGLATPGSGPHGGPPDIMVVGDDDQSIYGFRGASAQAFDRFVSLYEDDEHHPTRVTRQRLEINYRSRPIIVQAGQAIIERLLTRFDPDKVLRPNPAPAAHAEPGSIEGWTVPRSVEQYASLVARLIEADRAATSRPFSDYAVITRSHARADQIAHTLTLAGIPVDRRKRRDPKDSQAVQLIMDWVRMLVDPGDAGAALRVMLLPPFGVPYEPASRWLADYLRGQQRDIDPDAGSDRRGGGGEARGFLEWLAQDRASELTDTARVLIETARRVSAFARTQKADRVIETLIHDSGVAALAPEPAARYEMVGDLAALIRFVRARMSHVPAPGDLHAFWAHYNELDESERTLSDSDEEIESPSLTLDNLAAASGEAPTGVSVVTAHASKGLEFDTVFLIDVQPPTGFPSTKNPADDGRFAAPAGFFASLEQDRHEEERRLFYVACTRARRRLLLIAKHRKSARSSSTNYLDELTQDHPGLEVPINDGGPLLDADQIVPEPEGFSAPESDPWVSAVRQAARRQRSDALAALHVAEHAGDDPDRVEAMLARLNDHARALAAIRQLEQGRHDLAAQHVRAISPECRGPLEALLDRGELRRVASPFQPFAPPLRLSYSAISRYTHCPRCYWIAETLRITEQPTPAMLLGNAVHVALEWYYKRLRALETGDDAGRAASPGLWDDDTAGRPAGEPTVAAAMERAGRWLRGNTPPHQLTDESLVMQAREMVRVALERLHDPTAEILEVEHKFTFTYHTADDPGNSHTIVGKFDRLDRLPDGRLRIVDYKSRNPTQVQKSDPQLGVYALALRSMFGDDAQGVGEYWFLGSGERVQLDFSAIEWKCVHAWLDQAIEGMLAGRFDPGKNCTGLCRQLPLD
jgi:DNA helicase-2/ATP-dependent DNA helicase PcrA